VAAMLQSMLVRAILVSAALLLAIPCVVAAQEELGLWRGQAADGFAVRDSNVGYVDSAAIGDQIRLRCDTADDIIHGSRAEFIWAQGRPRGSGFPLPESSVDYQDFTAVCEKQLGPRWSAAVELPVRFLDPEINENSSGLADMNVALKYVLLDEGRLLTAQLRTYIPTGNPHEGLGTGHASLEPGLLLYQPLGACWAMEGELRYWVATGGNDFAGSVLRYGVGLHRPVACYRGGAIRPVVELVGWTVMDGLQSVELAPGQFAAEDASGETIVNAKFGVRAGLGPCCDAYIGYGRAITGDEWYDDTVRAELRFLY